MAGMHDEVSITKGGFVGRARQKRAKKKSGRSIDDMTVITIREMRLGPRDIGGEIVLRTCNTCSWTPGEGWSRLAKERIDNRRLHSDGEKKGRVLLAELHCMNAAPTVAAAACLHLEGDEVHIDAWEHPSDMKEHRVVLFNALLIAAERIACKKNDGRRATVIVNCEKGDAWWYKDRFGFKQARTHPDSKNRRLLGLHDHGPCRSSAKQRKGKLETARA